MKILLIEPQKRPRPHDIPNDLVSMQALVGGTIQAVYPFDEPVALICHEEGKLLGLPQNRALRHPDTGEIYDIICGTFFGLVALHLQHHPQDGAKAPQAPTAALP